MSLGLKVATLHFVAELFFLLGKGEGGGAFGITNRSFFACCRDFYFLDKNSCQAYLGHSFYRVAIATAFL